MTFEGKFLKSSCWARPPRPCSLHSQGRGAPHSDPPGCGGNFPGSGPGGQRAGAGGHGGPWTAVATGEV